MAEEKKRFNALIVMNMQKKFAAGVDVAKIVPGITQLIKNLSVDDLLLVVMKDNLGEDWFASLDENKDGRRLIAEIDEAVDTHAYRSKILYRNTQALNPDWINIFQDGLPEKIVLCGIDVEKTITNYADILKATHPKIAVSVRAKATTEYKEPEPNTEAVPITL